MVKRKGSNEQLVVPLTIIAFFVTVVALEVTILTIPQDIPIRNVELAILAMIFILASGAIIYLRRRRSQNKPTSEDPLSQTGDLFKLLDLAGIGPTRKLREFLYHTPNKERGDLAVDDHVLFQNLLAVNQRVNPVTIRLNFDKDLNAEKDGLECIGNVLRIPSNALQTMIHENSLDRFRGRPNPDRLKYFVKKIDMSRVGIDDGGVISLTLGAVRYSTILALKKMMYDDHIKVPGSDQSLHDHLKELPLIDDLNRPLFCAGIAIHLNVITRDNHVILQHRSATVEFHPSTWGNTVDESMKGEQDEHGPPDFDFQAIGIRGIYEELGISAVRPEEIEMLSLGGEYDDLEFAVHAAYRSQLTSAEIRDKWLLRPDPLSDKIEAHPLELKPILDLLINRKPEVPRSESSFNPDGPRMNLVLLLLRRFPNDELRNALVDCIEPRA
ncbi:MAG: hypothetical protein WB643_07225 [Candidatus Bathyarchaeia archaeon]